MKIKLLTLLLSASLFISAFSCSESTRSRKPVSLIHLTISGSKIKIGDAIDVTVQTKIKNGTLASVKLYLDNHLIHTGTQMSFNYQLKPVMSLGNHELKVIAQKTDGVKGINFKSVEVVSDVVPARLTYEVIHTYPHSTKHFTEGLEIHNNAFYESTGENGKSGIYKFDLETGKILLSSRLNSKYFGEGITIMGNKIYQLTYLAQKGFVYDLTSFSRIDSFSYSTPQGWGLTHDRNYLIKSDGTEFLHFLNPENFKVVRKLAVYDNHGPVKNLNELDYYEGVIYANIWTTSRIVKIDAKTGKVLADIDCTGLLPMHNPNQKIDVQNGIATNPSNGKMYVTGKLWPTTFEIKLVKKD